MIVNKFAKYCAVCGTKVEQGQGFARKEESGAWLTYCSPHKPDGDARPQKEKSIPEKPVTRPAPGINPITQTRELTADGKIIIKPWTYDQVTLALIKSMPGRRYDGVAQLWTVSMEPKHRAEVIKTARKLNLQIHPNWLDGYNTRADVAKKIGLYTYQISGVDWLNQQERAILGDEMGLGKAQPLSAKVLTPFGWKLMGEMKVGSEIIGRDGQTHKVTGVYPQGTKPVFEIEFTDGYTTRSTEEHLWAVNTAVRNKRGNKHQVMPLYEIANKLKDGAGNNRHFIPLVQAVNFPAKEVPIDPYFIGYLIANGNLTTATPRVTMPDKETLHRMNQKNRIANIKIKPATDSLNEIDYTIVGTNNQFETNPLTDKLRLLDLMGKGFSEKFVPEVYLYNATYIRCELFRGLMDGDGSVTVADNHLEYSSGSKVLAEQVVFLVQSFGGTASISVREEPWYTYDGEKKIGAIHYRVSIALPDGISPFELSRKSSVYHTRTKYKPRRAILSVKLVGKEECQCIAVDAEDHLYVTDNFIVTHNTVEAIMALEDKEPAIVVCPKNVKLNWKAEIKQWRPSYDVEVLKGTHSFRWPKQNEILVLNYDILPDWLMPDAEKYVTWKFEDQAAARETVVIFDEAHNAKNNKTAKHKKVKTLCQKVKKAWFLTGTPLTNKVHDLSNLLFALGRFNDTFGTMENFTERFQVQQKPCKVCEGSKVNHRGDSCPYCKGAGGFGHDWSTAKPDPLVPDILNKVMLRRTREQVFTDLPDVNYQTLVIDELSDKLRLQLDIAQEENEELLAMSDLPPFELFSAVRRQLAQARIPAMLEFVEDCEAQDVPLVVFSAHRDPIDALEGRTGWEVITGDTSVNKRQEIVEKYQRGELLGIGQTIQTAIGSNYTFGHTALVVDFDWTPALNSQAIYRLVRIGQKSKVNIVQMVSNHPLDLHLHHKLTEKMQTIKETVG